MSLSVKDSGESRLGIWLSVLGLAVVVPLAFSFEPLPDPGDLLFALLPGAVGGLASVTYWIALRIGKVSVVSPIVAMGGGFGAVLAVVALGERFDTIGYLAILAAVAGVVLASYAGTGEPTGVGWAFVAAILFGVYIVLIGEAAELVGALWAIAALRVATLLILVPYQLVRGLGFRVSFASGRAVTIAMAFDTLALLALSAALVRGPVAVVGVISGQFSLVTILLAAVFLHERLRSTQWVGVAIVIAATAVLIVTAGSAPAV